MSYPLVCLGDVADFINGVAFKPEDWGTEGKPIIRIQNLNDPSKEYNYTEREVKDTNIARKGDLLVSWSASLGVYEWNGQDACINQHIFKVVPNNEKIDKTYLKRALELSIVEMESQVHGATMKHITRGKFLANQIPLPPLAEQRRIASILDQADELRQKRQQAIEKLDQLLQATFIDMFGDPVSNPNNYEQIELDNFILVGPQNGLYKPANMYGRGTPIVRIDGFKSGDIIDNKEFKRLSLEESDIEKYKLNKFDLVINRVNSPEYIGKTALIRNLEESTVFESNMMRFAVDTSKLDTYYLLFFLKQQFVLNQIANKRKDAVNQSSINQQDVKSLIINVPPIELQTKFSNFFQKIDKNRNLSNQQALNFDNLFKALQNQAFNGTL